MALVRNEDQQLLARTAEDFFAKESPVSRVRQLRDGQDPLGFSRTLWRDMAQLGWQGILIPEQYGGLGMGYADMSCVLEAYGRNLVCEPLISCVLLGANTVLLAGSEAQKEELLPSVADGSLLLTLAWHEQQARYDVAHCTTTAKSNAGGFVLDGVKTLVPDGHTADRLVVSARTSGTERERGGVSLFLVDANTPGVTVTRQTTMDYRNAAMVELRGVEVAADALVGQTDGAVPILEDVIDRATAGLCVEMLGLSEAAFAMTMEYLKTREQFGVLIGTFQALKHRAATMFVELQLTRSAVAGACRALDGPASDGGDPAAAAAVSLAKARCSDTAVLVAYESIQMHGGIGMTDEHDIGFYAKRARVAELTFGDAAHHRDRYAALQGF